MQVLDLGFNLIRVIPTTAFKETKDLTLLALDGNPMAFIPEEAISHLNKSLRGLSLGGRFLTCDCKMRWITEWIQNFDLQVTSRERNPQFCGNPQHLRDRNFYQLNTRGTYLCYLLICRYSHGLRMYDSQMPIFFPAQIDIPNPNRNSFKTF